MINFEMNSVYFLTLNLFYDEDIFRRLILLLSEKEQKAIELYINNNDKQLSLFSKLLVRLLASNFLHISNSEIEFHKEDQGKPYIVKHPEFFFNISHSDNAIAVCISENRVGIDIEKIRKIDLQILNRVFSKEEQEYIYENRYLVNKRFFEIWTQKEAYIKMLGEKIKPSFLKSINIFDLKILENMYIFYEDDYIISVCGKSNINKITCITEDEFLAILEKYML